MHKYYFLKEILNNLISENDLSNLSLEKSNDDLSRLFRAFIMQFYNDCPDNQKSKSILESESNSPTLNVLETFFNIDDEVIKDRIESHSSNHMWNLFCPEAYEASEDPNALSEKLLKKRKLSNIKENKNLLTNPSKEILFSSNVLITTPLDFSSPNIPEEIKYEVQEYKNLIQSFWYDHPIPLDLSLIHI